LLALSEDTIVGINFFRTLYDVVPKRAYGTFTQTYDKLFKHVRQKLIRRGVLLWAETGHGDAKLERYRFALPRAVQRHLPPLLVADDVHVEAVTVHDGFRERLVKLLGSRGDRELSIQDGRLIIDAEPFTTERLYDWQDRRWMQTIRANYQQNKKRPAPMYYSTSSSLTGVTPTALVRYGLSRLDTNSAVKPQAFETLFALDYPNRDDAPALDTIFELGWQWGCLERLRQGDGDAYRLRRLPDWADVPLDYLTAKKQHVEIDVKTIPYSALAALLTMGRLEKKRGKLLLTPDVVMLSETTPDQRANRLAQWLKENSEAFANAFKQVEEQWGRVIVHENLLSAQVSDLSLRVTLEKAFDDGSVEGWMVFPKAMARKIETVVNRSGHVIKEVAADD